MMKRTDTPKFSFGHATGVVMMIFLGIVGSGIASAQAAGKEEVPKSHDPTFIAPGVELNQIDAICLLPFENARQDLRMNLTLLRGLAVEELDRLGYRAHSDCSSETKGGAGRWRLTVRIDDVLVTGAALTASLVDSQSEKEVWRNSKFPGFGRRYLNALLGPVEVHHLVSSEYPALFEAFRDGKKAPYPEAAEEARVNTPPAAEASLYILRPSRLAGSAVPWSFMVDGQQWGDLRNGEYSWGTLSAGEHCLQRVKCISLKAEPEKTYYVVISAGGLFSQGVEFVPAEKGERIREELRLSPQHWFLLRGLP